MLATLVLAVALVEADPVTGSLFYVPRIGESAVIHSYDMFKNSVAVSVQGFTSAEALSKYESDIYDALQASEEWNSAPPEKKAAVANRMVAELLTEVKQRGDLIDLPDMTKVRVLAKGTFNRRIESSRKDDSFESPPDSCFVEVTFGPLLGRKAWLRTANVRVPGSKNPYAGITPGMKNDEANEEKPAAAERTKSSPIEGEQEEKSRVQILDSAWKPSRSGNFVEVSCTFKNLSGFALSGLTANVVYKDQNRRLINSKEWFIGDVAPGEEKTFTATHPSDPRMDSYRIEFETTKGFKHAVVEVVTEDPRQSIFKPQRRGKSRANR
jgi:hypothetical protein